MQAFSLSNWLKPIRNRLIKAPTKPAGLQKLAEMPIKSLPRFVQECPEVFNNDLLASAALDRFTHHTHTLTIRDDSFRQRNRKKEILPTPA
jgi:hypothetical protein